MSEDMGPYQAECPERILKLLTPTDNKNANEWRENCWAKIYKRKNAPKINVGAKLMYGGKVYKVVSSLGKRGFMVEDEFQNYRLKTSQAKQSTILA